MPLLQGMESTSEHTERRCSRGEKTNVLHEEEISSLIIIAKIHEPDHVVSGQPGLECFSL